MGAVIKDKGVLTVLLLNLIESGEYLTPTNLVGIVHVNVVESN
jgi:hypothetical protein